MAKQVKVIRNALFLETDAEKIVYPDYMQPAKDSAKEKTDLKEQTDASDS